MPLLEKHALSHWNLEGFITEDNLPEDNHYFTQVGSLENGEQLLVKSETYLQILKNKDQRKRLVHEICTFLDSSQSVQEIDALRTENRKLKNANSRLRYKTKDWALKKEEYENEIERLSGEISNYLNVTNFWYEESELLSGQAKRILTEPKKHISTQTDGLEKRTVETQTEEDDSRVNLSSRNPV